MTQLYLLVTLKMPFSLAISVLGINPKAIITDVSEDLVSKMFIGTLFLIPMPLFMLNAQY